MSLFTVNVVARNPKQEELATAPIRALMDTGSELTWLPADTLRQIDIAPRRKRNFSRSLPDAPMERPMATICTAETGECFTIWRDR
jgi:hypothetical protein